jgi:hypothetical protein
MERAPRLRVYIQEITGQEIIGLMAKIKRYSKKDRRTDPSNSKERMTMKFENDKGQPVEINFQNFESILPGAKAGLTPVKLKNGREEWLKATKDEILEATVEE